jgi:hypothetical protein
MTNTDDSPTSQTARGRDDDHGRDDHGGKDRPFPIFIDKQKFEVTEDKMTGAELRALPTAPVGPDRDLYLIVPGGEDDLVDDTERVGLKPGTKFMTVPKLITPGRR